MGRLLWREALNALLRLALLLVHLSKAGGKEVRQRYLSLHLWLAQLRLRATLKQVLKLLANMFQANIIVTSVHLRSVVVQISTRVKTKRMIRKAIITLEMK